MLGVIMCGGESIRMGTDKGLMNLSSKTWAESAAEKLSVLDIPVVFSIHDRQFPAYKKVIDPLKLITDNPVVLLKGPVAGLLSVHLRYPAADLFIVACDLPLMESNVLEDLYLHYKRSKQAQAYLYTMDGVAEPLCGIYTAGGLNAILSMHEERRLIKHSMKFMLDHLVVDPIPIPETQRPCFTNFNSPPPHAS